MDQDLKASIDALRESVDALRVAIEATAGSGADHAAGSRDLAGGDVRSRLRELHRLESEGLISEDEYSEHKDQLLRHWSR